MPPGVDRIVEARTRTMLRDTIGATGSVRDGEDMSTEGLFHIDSLGQLVAMAETPYAAEVILQELLESHADLLAGGQMTPHDPRRWALIEREQVVPDSAESAGRWSIDHLFVDQDAVPTLVEVKRSSDTRIRREVVGQMLDYAANGVRYWTLDALRGSFERTQQNAGRDPLEIVRGLADDPAVTIESFFERVSDNLRSGRIRLVFVADVVPDELRRIVEFLNEQMNPAEVFAVEVKQYRADGYPGVVIVPAVIGRTAATITKQPSSRAAADRTETLERSDDATRTLLDLALNLATSNSLSVRETPGGLVLSTARGASLGSVWLAPYNTFDLVLEPLRSQGHKQLANEIWGELQNLTRKRLTTKAPSLPAADVLANWDAFSAVLLRLATEFGAR